MSTSLRGRIAVTTAVAVMGGMLAYASGGTASAATLLPAPVLTGPLSSSAQLKSVVLSWQPVPGATGYSVQVGTDEDWADDPTFSATSVAPRLTLPSWLPHAAYVWRVAATNGSGTGRWSASSPLGTFARGWRTAPTSLSASTDVHGIPTFSWAPIATASAYEVQFSNSPMFNDGLGAQTQASPAVQSCFTHRTRLTPFLEQLSHASVTAGPCEVTLLQNGMPAYWRVRGIDQLDSDAQEVDTTPATVEGISHQPPTSQANSGDFTDCPGPAPSSSPAPGTSPAASPSPSPSASASASASGSASPVASASPSASASSGATSGACTPVGSVEKGAWSGALTFTPTVSVDFPSDFRALPVVQTLPLTDDASNGCSGTTDVTCSDFPTIHWNPSVDASGKSATRYRLYISLDDAYSNIQRVVETSALQWTPTDSWRDSTATQSYYYVVQPCTSEGCGAVTTTPPSFKKRSPAVATIGHRLVNAASVFSWHDYADTLADSVASRNGGSRFGAPSEAMAYHVQVAKDDNPDFQSAELVDDAVVDGSLCAPVAGSAPAGTAVQSCASPATAYAAAPGSDIVTYANETKSYGDGSFLWRVQAVDASGHKLPWSPVGSFVRDATAPTITAAPTNNVSVKPLIKVTFSEPVTGVSASSLTLPGVTSRVVVLDQTHATIAPASALVPGASYQLSLSPVIKDLSGNSATSPGPVVTVNPLADDRSVALGYSGTWRTMASSNAVGGGFHGTTPTPTQQSAGSVFTSGSGVLITGCAGPSNGVMRVYVDGVLKATRDTYRSFSGCGVSLVRVTGLTKGKHRVQVRAIGTKRAASHGTNVGLDAVTALP